MKGDFAGWHPGLAMVVVDLVPETTRTIRFAAPALGIGDAADPHEVEIAEIVHITWIARIILIPGGIVPRIFRGVLVSGGVATFILGHGICGNKHGSSRRVSE